MAQILFPFFKHSLLSNNIYNIYKGKSGDEIMQKKWDDDCCAEDNVKIWDCWVLPVSCWAIRSQRSRFRTDQRVPYTEWWPLPTSKHTHTETQRQREECPSLHHLLIKRQQLWWWELISWKSLFPGPWREKGKCLYPCFKEHKALLVNTKWLWHQHGAQRLWLQHCLIP